MLVLNTAFNNQQNFKCIYLLAKTEYLTTYGGRSLKDSPKPLYNRVNSTTRFLKNGTYTHLKFKRIINYIFSSILLILLYLYNYLIKKTNHSRNLQLSNIKSTLYNLLLLV